MQTVAIALTAASAYSQYKQGVAQQKMMDRQAQQVELSGRVDALRAKEDGIAILDNMLEQLAYSNAYAAAGSVDPFSGSKLGLGLSLQAKGIREYKTNDFNRQIALDMSRQQAELLRYEGKLAKRAGITNALTTMGMGLYGFERAGGFTQMSKDFGFGGTTPGSTGGRTIVGSGGTQVQPAQRGFLSIFR